MARLDTRLESEAAEFLVLGHLLLARILAYKTYTNMPGYDLVASAPECGTSARIQVKSRFHSGAAGFPIKHFGCEFVVFVRLNRGRVKSSLGVADPEYFVFPVDVVRPAMRVSGNWAKVLLRDIPNFEEYRNNWALIAHHLGVPPPAS